MRARIPPAPGAEAQGETEHTKKETEIQTEIQAASVL